MNRIMRKFTTMAVMSMLFLGFGFVNAQSVAYVNSQDILESMPAYKTAQSTLETEANRHKAEVERQQNEIKSIYEKAQKKVDAVKDKSEAEKMKVMKELQPVEEDLQKKQQALGEYQQTASQKLAKKQEELMEPIYKKVQAAITTVGVAKKVGYIFDLAVAAQSGNMVYYGGGTDLTADVKKELGL